jgi:hypothetical protein
MVRGYANGFKRGPETVARLDAATGLKEGSGARLWLDPAGVQLLDPASGKRLRAQG